MRDLRDFLKSAVFGLEQWSRLFLMKMGQIFGFAMEIARREVRGVSRTGVSQLSPRRLETRIQRGFPHFHSDDCCGVPVSDEDEPR